MTAIFTVAIIAIVIMGLYIHKIKDEKSVEEQRSACLEIQVNELKTTIKTLQSKINTISNTINDNKQDSEIETEDSN